MRRGAKAAVQPPGPARYHPPAPDSVRRRRRGRVRPLVLWVALTFAGAALLATQDAWLPVAAGYLDALGGTQAVAAGSAWLDSSLDNLGQALEGLNRSLRAAR